MADKTKPSGRSSATSKNKKKRTAKSKSAAVPKAITDEDLVIGLKTVQSRKLTNSQFSAVSQTITFLEEE